MRRQDTLADRHVGWRVLLAVVLALILGQAGNVTGVLAQSEPFPTGATVRVANTDGQHLNLREGPSAQQTVMARLPAGETLTVTGASRMAEGLRWLPVRTSTAQTGWVAADYVTLVSAPTPSPTPLPSPTPVPPQGTPVANSEGTHRSDSKGRPVEVEAKLKYPELDGNKQEITVWVTRDGVSIVGATVTVEASDGDEDDEGQDKHFREMDPTDEEGRTRRSFDVRRERGTVELQVEAVAPDGGEGRTVVTYFRR